MKIKNRYYLDLITELVRKEMKVRYKSSVLGYLWSILLPLSQALIYYFAFKFVMKIQIPHYVLFLIVALFPWQWFMNTCVVSTVSLLANAQLIKKTTFPREFIVLAGVLNDMIHYLLSIPIIIIFFLIYHQGLSLNLIFIVPILIVIQFLITTGAALLFAALNIFFRDLERLVTILLNILFYATPIIYAETMIPERFRFITYLNPMAALIIVYRRLFLEGTIAWSYLGVSAISSVIIFLVGFAVFRSLKWRFAEVV